MADKKQPKVLTGDELKVVTGGARMFQEPIADAFGYNKFAPLKFAPLAYKFSPLT
jgi:hypothetical protein